MHTAVINENMKFETSLFLENDLTDFNEKKTYIFYTAIKRVLHSET